MLFERDYKTNRYKAFSFAELLVVLLVFGFIAVITLPRVHKNLPKQEAEMHKKVTYSIEQAVANMFEDETMYPKVSDDLKEGFQNTDAVFIDGQQYGSNAASPTDADRKAKFCKLFATKFNKMKLSSVFANEPNAIADGYVWCADAGLPQDTHTAYPTFITTDGVFWFVPITNFAESGKEGYAELMVDVNGNDGPNTLGEDRFKYYVKYNGTISLDNPMKSTANARKFKIRVNQTTKNTNNVDETPTKGGKVKIKVCDSEGKNCSAESEESSAFTNLARGAICELSSVPNTNYTSNWPANKRTIKIVNQDVKVNVVFREIQKSSIKLKVTGCPFSDVSQCGDFRLKKDCRYALVEGSTGQGTFKYDSSANTYEYAGINDRDANYNYICTSEAGGSTLDTSTSTITWSNLVSGSYGIEVVPTNDVFDGKRYIIPNIKNNKYVQNIRLGTVDLEFQIDFIVQDVE